MEDEATSEWEGVGGPPCEIRSPGGEDNGPVIMLCRGVEGPWLSLCHLFVRGETSFEFVILTDYRGAFCHA